ncbi:MAG: protein phosphatase 2C domain-containing protein [Planctomycetaceae bacterium]
MWWGQAVHFASKSDVGFSRQNNQDSLAVQICSDEAAWSNHGHLFLVADGMGGHAVGELASKIAADTIPHTFFKSTDENIADSLKKAIEQANANINERGTQNRDFERMGTTCTALVLSGQGAIIGHVGDSRLYRIRERRIDQLTFDHSLQWELIRQGKIKPHEIDQHEPRNVITRSLGPEPTVQVDLEGPYPIAPGDVYLLCSDGLTGHLSDQEIGMIANALPPTDACRALVNLANLRGGSDNITVVIVKIGEHSQASPAPRSQTMGDSTPGMNWRWLAGFWAAAILFVLGISTMLFNKPLIGGTMTVLSVAAAVYLVYAWRKRNPKPRPVPETGDDTVLWRPYRTADARLTRGFLNHLVTIHDELQHVANQENWSIEWSDHEQEHRHASIALNAGEFQEAMIRFLKAIDLLMAGLLANREHARHQRQWGKNNVPNQQK